MHFHIVTKNGTPIPGPEWVGGGGGGGGKSECVIISQLEGGGGHATHRKFGF